MNVQKLKCWGEAEEPFKLESWVLSSQVLSSIVLDYCTELPSTSAWVYLVMVGLLVFLTSVSMWMTVIAKTQTSMQTKIVL